MKSFPQVNEQHNVDRVVHLLIFDFGNVRVRLTYCSQRWHCIAKNMSISCLPKQRPKYQITQ